jgi:hypothetical protein
MHSSIKTRTVTNTSVIPEHNESSAPLILWVLPLVGAVLIPGLWWTSADSPFAFRPDLIGTMTLFVAIVAVATLAIVSRGFRRRIRWSLGVTTALVVGGFQWSTFTITGESVAESTGIPLVIEVLPVALAGALLWITVRLAGDTPFAVIAGVGMAVAVAMLAVTTFSLVAPAPPDITATVGATPESPDVLFLVLDGYGRDDWLATEYQFDNTPFLDELRQRGFTIAKGATPNYSYTYASVSTMLNLDYVFAPGEINDTERKKMRAAITGAAGLIPMFKAAGYDITYVENAWGASQCGSAIDRCIRDGLVRRSMWNLGQMTILAPIFRMITLDPFNALSVDQLESLDEWLAGPADNEQPRFTFAHILLPHAPLLLNADCSRDAVSELTRWGAEDGELRVARRANYTDQIGCVNRRVLEAVDAFLAAHPGGLIMITGDHGPGSTLDANLDLEDLDDYTILERMKILSAYRVPGCEDGVRSDITPVNGTRLLVNCATGAELEPLPDYNYWSDLDGEGRVSEITSMVQG